MKTLRLLYALLLLSVATGCSAVAPPNENVPEFRGPEVRIDRRIQKATRELAKNLPADAHHVPITVVFGKDETGRLSISGDNAIGALNTQAVGDMAYTALGMLGLQLVDSSPEFRAWVDWYIDKGTRKLLGDGTGQFNKFRTPDGKLITLDHIPSLPGTIAAARFGIIIKISGSDFWPGGGGKLEVNKTGGGFTQDRIFQRVDARLITLPFGNLPGGEVIATTAVKKQLVQDRFDISISSFLGASPTLVEFSAGMGHRETIEESMAQIVEIAVDDLLAQTFHVKGVFESDQILSNPPPQQKDPQGKPVARIGTSFTVATRLLLTRRAG